MVKVGVWWCKFSYIVSVRIIKRVIIRIRKNLKFLGWVIVWYFVVKEEEGLMVRRKRNKEIVVFLKEIKSFYIM